MTEVAPRSRLPSPRRRLGPIGSAVLLAGVLLAFLLTVPLFGDVPLAPAVGWGILLHQFSGGFLVPNACGSAVTASRCTVLTEIVWDAWVPEMLLAFGVGAALGLSGATLQGVFRNPLADPYLLGLSSGAAVGAALLFVFAVGQAEANLTLPLFAFAGSILTGGLVLTAARSPRASTETLLLTGVAINAFLSAVLVFALLYNPVGSLQLSFWLLGGLFGASWGRVGIVLGGILVTGSLLALYGRTLNLLQLGPDVAQSLGVDSRRAVFSLLLLSSVTTALAVAFAGVIGFVGLVAPHLVRRLFGYDYRLVLPASAGAGAVLLAGAFDLSRVLLAATVLPVGVPMAFVGGPFFVYVLYRRRARPGGRVG